MMHDFLLALGYFTRIPVPPHPNFTPDALKRSAVYFPLVGLLVGSVLGVIYIAVSQLWPPMIAVIITLSVGFMITGGFHEDGWADTADGLGGAFERDKKLHIMTDSRLGTYGSLALWANLTLKAAALTFALPEYGFLLWILLHTLSRWVAMISMVCLPYAKSGDSKAKPVVQTLSWPRWLLSGAVCTVPLLWVGLTAIAFAAVALLFGAVLWLQFIDRQLGGYTGDTLGAHQQLNEILILLTLLALL